MSWTPCKIQLAHPALTTAYTVEWSFYTVTFFQAFYFSRRLEPRRRQSAEAQRQHEPHPVPQQRRAEDRLRGDGPRLRDRLPAAPEGAGGPGIPGKISDLAIVGVANLAN